MKTKKKSATKTHEDVTLRLPVEVYSIYRKAAIMADLSVPQVCNAILSIALVTAPMAISDGP